LSKWGIQNSNKQKEKLIDLCVNAQDLHVAQLKTDEACEVAIENKFQTPEGDLPKPRNLTDWHKVYRGRLVLKADGKMHLTY